MEHTNDNDKNTVENMVEEGAAPQEQIPCSETAIVPYLEGATDLAKVVPQSTRQEYVLWSMEKVPMTHPLRRTVRGTTEHDPVVMEKIRRTRRVGLVTIGYAPGFDGPVMIDGHSSWDLAEDMCLTEVNACVLRFATDEELNEAFLESNRSSAPSKYSEVVRYMLLKALQAPLAKLRQERGQAPLVPPGGTGSTGRTRDGLAKELKRGKETLDLFARLYGTMTTQCQDLGCPLWETPVAVALMAPDCTFKGVALKLGLKVKAEGTRSRTTPPPVVESPVVTTPTVPEQVAVTKNTTGIDVGDDDVATPTVGDITRLATYFADLRTRAKVPNTTRLDWSTAYDDTTLEFRAACRGLLATLTAFTNGMKTVQDRRNAAPQVEGGANVLEVMAPANDPDPVVAPTVADPAVDPTPVDPATASDD